MAARMKLPRELRHSDQIIKPEHGGTDLTASANAASSSTAGEGLQGGEERPHGRRSTNHLAVYWIGAVRSMYLDVVISLACFAICLNITAFSPASGLQ